MVEGQQEKQWSKSGVRKREKRNESKKRMKKKGVRS
jgi:hypothetical protein